jgi:hypothetical protein
MPLDWRRLCRRESVVVYRSIAVGPQSRLRTRPFFDRAKTNVSVMEGREKSYKGELYVVQNCTSRRLQKRARGAEERNLD